MLCASALHCYRRIGGRVPDGAGNHQDSVCVASGLAAVVHASWLWHSGRVMEQVLLDPSSRVSCCPSDIPTSAVATAAAAAAAAVVAQLLSQGLSGVFGLYLR